MFQNHMNLLIKEEAIFDQFFLFETFGLFPFKWPEMTV